MKFWRIWKTRSTTRTGRMKSLPKLIAPISIAGPNLSAWIHTEVVIPETHMRLADPSGG